MFAGAAGFGAGAELAVVVVVGFGLEVVGAPELVVGFRSPLTVGCPLFVVGSLLAVGSVLSVGCGLFSA